MIKKYRTWLALAACVVLPAQLHAQAVPSQAFTGVTLHLADGTTVPKATILWRGGSIVAAGTSVQIPFDARVTDGGDSLHVYPAWVDGLGEWGMPEVSRERTRAPQPGNPTYEQAGIQPDRKAQNLIVSDSRDFGDWRKLGFAAAALAPRGFMLPGSVSLFTLQGVTAATDNARLITPDIAQRSAIQGAMGVYPGTPMAVMARFRQLMFDAEALKVNNRLFQANPTAYQAPVRDAVLEALIPVADGDTPLFFSANSPDEIRRVLKLKEEFGFRMVLVSGLGAGKMADELAKANIPVLVSFNFVKKPAFLSEKPADDAKPKSAEQQNHNKRQEEAWKEEVANVSNLLKAGVTVGFSSVGLRSADFQARLKDLVESGVAEADLVKILTANTAKIIGQGNYLGDLKQGMLAGFNVYTGRATDAKSRLVYSVAGGELKLFPAERSAQGGAGRPGAGAPRSENSEEGQNR